MPARPDRPSLAATAFALALVVAPCAAAAAGPCPASSLDLGTVHVDTGAPRYDAPATAWDGTPVDVGFDLTTGTITAYTPGGLYRVYVRPHDLYDVTGVAPGTPVPVTVELACTGWVHTDGCNGSGCSGVLEASIVTPSGTADQSQGQNIFTAGTRANDFAVQAPLVLTAGTPVPVSFLLQAFQAAGGSHASYGQARVRFLGLPPGAAVTSCQGYLDAALPALSASWGRLKAAYR